jgi:hypothetical protein
MDELAARSHRVAHAATEEGGFEREIMPVVLDGETVVLDQGIRPDTSAEALERLKPAFRSDGRVAAGVVLGVDPVTMLTGPIPATKKILARVLAASRRSSAPSRWRRPSGCVPSRPSSVWEPFESVLISRACGRCLGGCFSHAEHLSHAPAH